MKSNGLSLKNFLILVAVVTPFALCMKGGVIAVLLFWIIMGILSYATYIRPSVLLEKEIKRITETIDDPTEDWEVSFEQRCREEGKLSKGQLQEICDKYGFTTKGKYSLLDMDLTIETHRSIEQLHEMGIYTTKDILGKFFFQVNTNGFEEVRETDENGKWFWNKNNIMIHLFRYHEDRTKGRWQPECIYEITYNKRNKTYDIYKDSYVKRGVSEAELTDIERDFFNHNRSRSEADGRIHWVLNIDNPQICEK